MLFARRLSALIASRCVIVSLLPLPTNLSDAVSRSPTLGGGTGAGMGTLLMSKIREEFLDQMMCM
jgi:hypothetical protein